MLIHSTLIRANMPSVVQQMNDLRIDLRERPSLPTLQAAKWGREATHYWCASYCHKGAL